jgi:hypothetical protein
MQISSTTGSPSVTGSQTITPAKPTAKSTTPTNTASASGAASTPAATAVQSPAQAANAAIQALTDSTYSTSVGGKSYSGNVSQSDGLYEISVPNLPGSSVSASSLQGAENALNARIDLLA